MRGSGPIAALLVGVLAWSSAAHAGEAESKRADALYKEAVALVDAGNYAAACPRYEESQKLDPALGTQFNLADCWEHTGLAATAYTSFVSVERAARAAGKANLATRAHERVVALDPKVPRLALAAGSVPDLVVKIDGRATSIDAPIAVDPGKHVIDATAPGRRPFHAEVALDHGTTPVKIELAVMPIEAPRAAPPPPEKRPVRGYRIAGAVVAGVGLAGIALGAVSGTRAIAKRNDARDACGSTEPSQCHAESGLPLWDDASSAGNLSTIGFVAGGALLAAGAALWLLAPSRPVKTQLAFGRFGIGGTF